MGLIIELARLKKDMHLAHEGCEKDKSKLENLWLRCDLSGSLKKWLDESQEQMTGTSHVFVRDI